MSLFETDSTGREIFPKELNLKVKREEFLDAWFAVSKRSFNARYDRHSGDGAAMISDIWTDDQIGFDSGRESIFSKVWRRYKNIKD